ncbi:MAG: hypothetical protein OEV06_03505 [Anaerolineae bacterium]|nr:hypothetical protein [Anaerolineae bacterium]
MKILRLSLKALSHPASLAAIVLLLVNDHILKASAPSPLTGKLSDFAGLLFFPFLLAIAFGLPLERLGLKAMQIAKLCIGATAIWFVGIKTMPAINNTTESLVETFTGRSSLIVLDWTDLIALLSLWGTWRIFEAVDKGRERAGIPKVAYLALAAASLGSLATSAEPPESVRRIIHFEGELYAGLIYDWGEVGDRDEIEYKEYFVSGDLGATWTEIEPSLEIVDLIHQRDSMPEIICAEEDPDLCYRITGEEQIDISLDGKETWEIGWRISAGRREYMERRGVNEFGVYDIELINFEGGHALISAMGTQGALIMHEDGTWERVRIYGAYPSDMAASSWDTVASIINWESFILFFISIVFFYFYANRIRQLAANDLKILPVYLTKPWLFLYLGLFIILLGEILFPRSYQLPFALQGILAYIGESLFFAPINLLLPFGVVVILSEHFRYRNKLQDLFTQKSLLKKLIFTLTISALVIFPASWLIMAVWAFGIIDSYNLALGLMLFVVIATLLLSRNLIMKQLMEMNEKKV